LRESGKSDLKPDVITFNTIIKGCAYDKKERLGFQIFNYMKECGKSDPTLKPNDVTYNSLIDACVRANKMTKAWALLKEMQEES
jgi:pentatricopeptide repeat protein